MMTVMAPSLGDRAAGLLKSARSYSETSSRLQQLHHKTSLKLQQLQQLEEVILHQDPSSLPDFVPRLAAELQANHTIPVRIFLAGMIGEIGLKWTELIPKMVPTLISFLEDETPAVARQAIATGTSLFQSVLLKIASQVIYSGEIDDSLESSWACMLKFKNAVLPVAVQSGSDGVRIRALKFVETMILLYTPDTNGRPDPPPEINSEHGFNMLWLKGRHPLLDVGDLAMEATAQHFRLLLDQLRFQVKSISNSIVIVLINSLSTIANKIPSLYGRILPVLLGFDPARSIISGMQVSGAHNALKKAFETFLKCTHRSTPPWRERVAEALECMSPGELAEEAVELTVISESSAVSREGLSTKEDKFLLQACDERRADDGRKRPISEENDGLPQESGIHGKRIRSSPSMLQGTSKGSPQTTPHVSQSNHLPFGSTASSRYSDSGPVQQLVAMFGALVAQGDKAAESLEILISSISSDLLAEVVMANMRYLPSTVPKADEKEDVVPSINHHLFSAIPDNFSLSTAFPLIVSLLKAQRSASHDLPEIQHPDEERTIVRMQTSFGNSNVQDSIPATSTGMPAPIVFIPPVTEESSAIPLYENDVERIENTISGKSAIPGLESTSCFDEIEESKDASPITTELRGTSQEHDATFDMFSGSIATSVSETLGPSRVVTDASLAPCLLSVVSAPFVLPKMSVPDVILTDEQKDQLQKEAFLRILSAFKQVAASGGSHIQFSILSHLGIEFPLELNSWGLLQNHVLSDYLNHEGHELTLRVLYGLYRDVEQDQDFFLSRTATSVYESFLLTVVEALRDTFPASDKSFSRLLCEAPYLSERVFELLDQLCSPESDEKHDDFQSGDRVTQGLSAVWNIILARPSNRDKCLQIALKSTVHHIEEVRMKAIRLVANKLFPMPSIAKNIEDFACAKLQAVVDDNSLVDIMDCDESTASLPKDNDLERPSNERHTPASHDNHEHPLIRNTSLASVSEAQQFMSLFFALCTKKHSLLQQIFAIYSTLPKSAKQAVQHHVPKLIRTIGPSSELLNIISDPANGSEDLLMQVLQTLTEAAIPSQDLMSSLRRLYNSKRKDVEILIPVLPFLSKDEVLPIFPQLVNLPMDKFQAALTHVLQACMDEIMLAYNPQENPSMQHVLSMIQYTLKPCPMFILEFQALKGSPQTGPSLTPAEVLIAIHAVDPERNGIPLKKVMDACSACFEQREVFTQQVLAKVLNQLVEQIPLTLLFMRTVLQAIGVYPALQPSAWFSCLKTKSVDFVMEILSRLVSKQIWKYQKLWVGFLKCAIQTRPQSFSVLLQLPAAQLENALSKNPVLKAPLVEYANQPNIRSSLPRSTWVVLGLVDESQASGQAQASQSQAADTGSSAADATTEVTQDLQS